jgi:Tfp pilus assembly protein PilF
LALLEQGKLQEAMTEFREALGLKTSYADAHYNLALALQKSGQAHAARRNFSARKT